jgi:adenylosuccinate lyase
MEQNAALTAVSPIDGRYRRTTEALMPYFSEYALIRYRIWVEIEYFIALCDIPLKGTENFPKEKYTSLRDIYLNFSLLSAEKVKKIEFFIKHDVKAVEYFIKDAFDDLQIAEYKEFVHFGLTSQDINNTAVPMMLRDALTNVILPPLQAIISNLLTLAKKWAAVPMLAHTHGQPASPTTLGKEIAVFAYRLQQQTEHYPLIYAGKFGGATGNFNAHNLTYPATDWCEFADKFLEEKLGLKRSQLTTQIENYDHLAAILDFFKRINVILTDFSRDIWTYISMNYFKQKINENEVGSSAMPHKVNPIDFENAEGNLMTANALFEFLAAKLPVSRLQRDLTDSTVLRNIGVPFAHTLIAFNSLKIGLSRIEINEAKISADLHDNWAVIAEAYQNILRRENFKNPYELLKSLTRTGEKLTAEDFQIFTNLLETDENTKAEMRKISPENYVGLAEKMVKDLC